MAALPYGAEGGRKGRNTEKGKKGASNANADEPKKDGYEVKQRPVLDSNFVMTQDKLVRLDEDLVQKENLPTAEKNEDLDAAQEDEAQEGNRTLPLPRPEGVQAQRG